MKIFSLLGPPGCGKGTLSSLLKSRLAFEHFSTGDILRREVKSGSALGLSIRSVMESGQLVSDELIIKAVSPYFSGFGDNSVVWDGFPRSVPQAEYLLDFFGSNESRHFSAVLLSVADSLVIKRLSSRISCASCNTPTHFSGSEEELPSLACSSCGVVGSWLRRSDDAPEAIRNRLDVYKADTLPLVEFYQRKGLLRVIDASMEPEAVFGNFVGLFESG